MLGIGKNMSKSMRRRTVRITALVFMLLFSETLVDFINNFGSEL